jgi:branched-chain amino acid transport system ATP-binding protein
MLLAVDQISAGYGPLAVIQSVQMNVAVGECVALLGWSGAGKTTLLKTIAGLIRPSSGSILLDGEDIVALPAHRRLQMGMALIPEGRRLFVGMTVHENLLVGAHTLGSRALIHRQLDRVLQLFPALAERRSQIAGTLSGGEQQMCAIGRAIMSAPRLMLIDELSLGLAPVVVERLAQALAQIRQSGATIVLVEQDLDLAFKMADRSYVLQRGRIVRHLDGRSLPDERSLARELPLQ